MITRTHGPTPTPVLAAKNVELVGHLGGAIGAISVQGDYAYVGGVYGFNVLDVSDPKRPVQLSYLAVPTLDLVVADSYAYIVDGQIGLRILDVSDPVAPIEVGSHELPDDTQHLVVADAAGGKQRHVYAVSHEQGVFALDVSDPTAPFQWATYQTSPSESYYDIVISRHDSGKLYAFLTTWDRSKSNLEIVDISSPGPLTLVKTLKEAGGTLAIKDHYLYASQVYGGSKVFDVSNPKDPKEIAKYDDYFSNASVEGNHLYITRPEDNLGVVDISNPAQPVQVAASPPYFNDYAFQPEAIATAGQYVYAANNKGMYVVDVSDPSAPIQAGFYDTLTASYDLAIEDGYAYLTRGAAYNSWNFLGAFSVVDVSDPTAPSQVGYHEFEHPAYSVALANGYAYVGQGYCSWGEVSCAGRLSVLDVSNPATLEQIGVYEPGPSYPSQSGLGTSNWLITDVSVSKEWGYLTGLPYFPEDSGGLEILHMPDFVTPTDTYIITASLSSKSWSPASVQVVDNGQSRYAYLAGWQYGLRVLDISERSQPVVVGSYPIPNARDVVVVGQLAYVLDGTDLWIMDVSDPTLPQPIRSHSVWGGAWRLAIDGSFAYITNTYDKLQVLDISDPLQPRQVGFYITTGSPNGIAVSDGYIYVADYDGGLVILRPTR